MVWLWSKFTLRRQLEGEEARRREARLPARARGSCCSSALRGAIEARRRARADRPAGGAAGARATAASRSPRARRAPSAAATTRARFEPAGEPERYDRVLSTLPNDVFDELLAATCCAGRLRRPGCARSSTTPRCACCSSSTARSARSTGPTSPTATLPFIGLIEHTNFVEPERYDGRRFLYVSNYLAARPRAAGRSTRRGARPLHAGPAQGQPGASRATGSATRWLFREPAAQPIVTVGYRDRIPPLQTGVPGLVLANTTQVYPEDRGTNYAVRLGEQAAAERALPQRTVKRPRRPAPPQHARGRRRARAGRARRGQDAAAGPRGPHAKRPAVQRAGEVPCRGSAAVRR